MKKVKFLICRHCGNIITYIEDNKVIPYCCGVQMNEITPNDTDASFEKHIPVVTKDGNSYKISVGSTLHPMEKEHYIKWLVIETTNGFYTKYFNYNDKPEYTFISNDEVINVYAYCNIHSLFKKEIK